MKASLFTGPGSLEIADVAVDTPAPHEVLIRTAATGVCHSDLHMYDGTLPHAVPAILGHEAAGIVEEVGSEVRAVRPGDHVITCLSMFCGVCPECLHGRTWRCFEPRLRARPADATPRLSLAGQPVAQFTGLGTFAEQMLVHENAVVAVSDSMPLDRAALIGCAVVTGLGAVFNTAKVTHEHSVAIFGCGGIGLNCVQGARLSYASRIIAVDREPAKLALASRLGATDTIDAGCIDPVARIKELTNGGVDHAFEAVGLKQTAEQAFASLRMGGTATVIGVMSPDVRVEVSGYDLLQERRLQGSLMGSNRFRLDMPRYVALYQAGSLELDGLIAERIGLAQLPAALETLRSGSAVRSVIVFDTPTPATVADPS